MYTLILSIYNPLNKINYLKINLDKYVSKSKEFNEFLKFVFFDSKLENEISKSSKITFQISQTLMKLQYEQNHILGGRFSRLVLQNFKLLLSPLPKTELNKNYFKHPETFIFCQKNYRVD